MIQCAQIISGLMHVIFGVVYEFKKDHQWVDACTLLVLSMNFKKIDESSAYTVTMIVKHLYLIKTTQINH